MSTLSALDAMVLRETAYPPLTTKAAELTYAEWDQRVIDMYAAIQDIVSGGNVEAYNPATVYDSTSSDPYLKFVGYNSRIWQAVFAGTFSGQTPAEGVYWTQITLAQMLPNVLKLVEVGNGTSQAVKTAKISLTSAQVLQLFTTPVAFGITVPTGYYIKVLGADVITDFNTTPYDTNTTLQLGYVGGGVSYFFRTTEALLSVSTNIQSMEFQGYPSDSTSGGDVVVFVGAGNPMNGDSDITIYITYLFVEL